MTWKLLSLQLQEGIQQGFSDFKHGSFYLRGKINPLSTSNRTVLRGDFFAENVSSDFIC